MNLYEHKNQLGWLTTAANRPQIIETFAAMLAAAPRLFNSTRLLEECRTFVRHPNATASARSGAHDDCVMAMAIALQVRAEETGKTKPTDAESIAICLQTLPLTKY